MSIAQRFGENLRCARRDADLFQEETGGHRLGPRRLTARRVPRRGRVMAAGVGEPTQQVAAPARAGAAGG